MKASHVPPEEVTSPKRRWSLIKVLHDSGEGDIAVAIGYWDGKAVCCMRWNGDEDNRIGNPQSRGLPTWFVIPDAFRGAIIKSLEEDGLDTDASALARALFPELGKTKRA